MLDGACDITPSMASPCFATFSPPTLHVFMCLQHTGAPVRGTPGTPGYMLRSSAQVFVPKAAKAPPPAFATSPALPADKSQRQPAATQRASGLSTRAHVFVPSHKLPGVAPAAPASSGKRQHQPAAQSSTVDATRSSIAEGSMFGKHSVSASSTQKQTAMQISVVAARSSERSPGGTTAQSTTAAANSAGGISGEASTPKASDGSAVEKCIAAASRVQSSPAEPSGVSASSASANSVSATSISVSSGSLSISSVSASSVSAKSLGVSGVGASSVSVCGVGASTNASSCESGSRETDSTDAGSCEPGDCESSFSPTSTSVMIPVHIFCLPWYIAPTPSRRTTPAVSLFEM